MYSVKEDRIMYSGGELGIRMYSEGELSIRTYLYGSLVCTSVLFGPPTPCEDILFVSGLFIIVGRRRVDVNWSIDQTKNSTRL